MAEGRLAINAMRFAVSRGPNILNQCGTVSSKFLLAICRKILENIFSGLPARTTSKKKELLITGRRLAGFYKLRQLTGSDWRESLD